MSQFVAGNGTSKRVRPDEFFSVQSHFRVRDDILMLLRKEPGIPTETHVHRDGRIFVLKALVEYISATPEAIVDGKFDKSVLSRLVDQAWMKPEEVGRWWVMPLPYYPHHMLNGKYSIWIRALAARIPVEFDTLQEAYAAGGMLFAGPILDNADQADFVHQGQPLKMVYDYNIESLPQMPDLTGIFDVEKPRTIFLKATGFALGYGHVDHELYSRWCTLAADVDHCAREVGNMASSIGDEAFQLISGTDLSSLNLSDQLPASFGAQVTALRQLYPELTSLNDSALFWLYDHYLDPDSSIQQGWQAERTPKFIAYLVCKLAPAPEQVEVSADEGFLILLGMKAGRSVAESAECIRQWFLASYAVTQRFHALCTAMDFLSSDQPRIQDKAEPLATTSDVMNMLRKRREIISSRRESVLGADEAVADPVGVAK